MKFYSYRCFLLLLFGLTIFSKIASADEYFVEKLYNHHFDSKLTTVYFSNNGQNIYLGTNQGFIYVSNDKGATWQESYISTADVTPYLDFSEELELYLPDDGRKDYPPSFYMPLLYMTTNSVHKDFHVGRVRSKDFTWYDYNIQKRRNRSSDPGNILSTYLYSYGTPTIIIKQIAEDNNHNLYAITNIGLYKSTDNALSWHQSFENIPIKPVSNKLKTVINGTNYQFEQGKIIKNIANNKKAIPLLPGMNSPLALITDNEKHGTLWVLTASQLYEYKELSQAPKANISNMLAIGLKQLLFQEPSIGEAINSSLEYYNFTYDDLEKQRRIIRLSHLAPRIKLDFLISSNYMTWRAFGFGKLGSIPHSAPIIWLRKHSLGVEQWNPTKYLTQLDGSAADDDAFGYEITLVASWNLWGLVHDSRLSGRTWSRLQRTQHQLELETRRVYEERYRLALDLLYQPSSLAKKQNVLLRIEELTTLLNQYTNNKFNTFSALDYLEELNEN